MRCRPVRPHPQRDAVLALLQKEPGLTPTQVWQAMRMHSTTAQYHLDCLTRSGKVASHAFGRHRRFFVNGDHADMAKRLAYIRREGGPRLRIFAIASAGPFTVRAMARSIGLSPTAVNHHLRHLRSVGALPPRRT